MAERRRDLVDVLLAAQAQREAALADDATAAAAERARTAVRVARARRRAVVVVAAAAAVAVVVAGAVAWSPRASAPPAAPDPRPTASSAQVPGRAPLRQADEDDVRGAPAGSALALWAQPAAPGDATRAADAAVDLFVLLVLPDGEVLQVGPAPRGAVQLGPWDRAAGTVGVALEGPASEGLPVMDLLTGRVVGTTAHVVDDGASVSPDGRGRARAADGDVWVERDGVEVRRDLPAGACRLLAWADDTRLLLGCPALDDVTLRASGDRGATTVLVDAATGAVVEHRTVPADEPRPTGPVVRLDDGRLVAWLLAPEDDGSFGRECPVRLGQVDGTGATPFAELPSDALAYPGLVAVPGGVLVAGTTACDGRSVSPALWRVDATTGDVTPLLPSVESIDRGTGVRSWTTGD